MIAPLAAARPDIVRDIGDGGHEIGLHCWTHERHSRSARHVVEDETDRALAALAGLGVAPRLWRTPWGDTAEWTADVAAARDLTLVRWTADTHDWRGDTAEEMLDAIRDDLAPGGSVLMHDGLGPGARRADCLQTLRLLAPLAREARVQGLALDVMGSPVGTA